MVAFLFDPNTFQVFLRFDVGQRCTNVTWILGSTVVKNHCITGAVRVAITGKEAHKMVTLLGPGLPLNDIQDFYSLYLRTVARLARRGD